MDIWNVPYGGDTIEGLNGPSLGPAAFLCLKMKNLNYLSWFTIEFNLISHSLLIPVCSQHTTIWSLLVYLKVNILSMIL